MAWRALLLLPVLLTAPARGQTFERFGVRDGLSSEAVTDLAVGPDGVLWVATEDGLDRYDGHGFRVWRHRPDYPSSLPSSRLEAVVVTRAGDVWVGTRRGPARLDLRTGRFTVPDGLAGGVVARLIEADGGGVWVGTTDRGLWRVTPDGRARRVPLRLNGHEVTNVELLAGGPGGAWALGNSGEGQLLCRAEPGPARCQVPSSEQLIDVTNGGIALASPGRIRFGAGAGAAEWAVSALGQIYAVGLRVADDEVWFGGPLGVVVARADGTSQVLRAEPDRRGGLGGHDVRALALDGQGGIWVGTEAGLYVTRPPTTPFETVRHRRGDPATLSDDRVNGMDEGPDGSLWIATNDGLNRLRGGRVERLGWSSSTGGAFGRAFWRVLVTRSGEVLVGTKRYGLHRWSGAALVRVPSVEGPGVRDLVEDRAGRVWVAMGAQGVWRRDGLGQFRKVLAPRATIANGLFEDAAGRVWVGTDAGLLRLDAEAGRLVPVAGGRITSAVWSMAETPADPGALWVAAVGGGLVRFDVASGRVERVGIAEGLPTESVVSVLTAPDGALWAGTTAGLVRLDPRPDAGGARRVTTFTSADGLQGDAFDLMAALALSDGRLAFGGPGGLTLVEPRAPLGRRAPGVVLSRFEWAGRLARGTPVSGDTVRLAHDANAFGVRFAALDFRAPRQTRYRYRLVGLDADWQTTDGTAPRAAYAGVPPGQYRFEVVGAAADSPFGTEPAVLHVVVQPAWWQRGWVRGGVAGLALVLAALVGVVGTRRRGAAAARAQAEAVEVQRRLAEGQERERRRLARDLHDGPVQGLYRIGHDLDALGRTAPSGDGAPAEGAPVEAARSETPALADVRGRVSDVAGELREMLTQLRPTLAHHLALPDALDALASRFARRHRAVEVVTEYSTEAEGADDEVRLALYRIAQEALENAGRHAQAATVRLSLSETRAGLRLTVEDDGQGFAVPERLVTFARAAHYGLVGMAERAEAVGGWLTVEARPGGGTRVSAEVPLVAVRPD